MNIPKLEGENIAFDFQYKNILLIKAFAAFLYECFNPDEEIIIGFIVNEDPNHNDGNLYAIAQIPTPIYNALKENGGDALVKSIENILVEELPIEPDDYYYRFELEFDSDVDDFDDEDEYLNSANLIITVDSIEEIPYKDTFDDLIEKFPFIEKLYEKGKAVLDSENGKELDESSVVGLSRINPDYSDKINHLNMAKKEFKTLLKSDTLSERTEEKAKWAINFIENEITKLEESHAE